MRLLLGILITLILIVGCSSVDITGTTTETTGEHAGLVLTSAGYPISNASVSLYNIRTNVYDTTVVSNTDGSFILIPEETETYHMSILSPDSSSSCWYYYPIQSEDDTIEAVLSQPNSFDITIEDAPQGLELGLVGTPFFATVTGGEVSWRGLPNGRYTVVDTSSNTVNPLGSFSVPNDTAAVILIDYNQSGLLFDDFNDGDNHPVLFPLSKNIRTWEIEKPTVETFSDRLEKDSSGGYVLHIPETGVLRKAITKIGPNVDFTTLDSITFRARGEGILRIALEDDYNPPESVRKILFKTTLTSSWKTYTIAVNSHPDTEFMEASSWDEFKDQIDYITIFMYAADKELWFDDLRLYGITTEMLIE